MTRAYWVVLVGGLMLASMVQAKPIYVDARDYPTQGAGRAAFEALEAKWREGFTIACMDAICDTGYNNYLPVHLSCAVRADDGILKSCHWAIAGSARSIHPGTGRGEYEIRTAVCEIPLAADTPLAILLATAATKDPFDDPLPGAGTSVYTSISDCLSARTDDH